MFGFTLCALFASTILSTARADPVPSAPGPGDVFKEGGQCTFTWTPDTTGQWKVMNVELMTGSNFQMVHLTTVGTFDGTSATTTSHSYPCPAVKPNSAIYFYQFSSPASGNRTWTTRFAISDSAGHTTPPSEQTQPGGAPIPWGTGALVNAADAKPPPPNGGGNSLPSSVGTTNAPAGTTSTPPAVATPAAPATTTTGSSQDDSQATTIAASSAATTTASTSAAVSLSFAAATRVFQVLCAVGTVAMTTVLFA